MKTIINELLTDIQTATQNCLDTLVSGLRVSKAGNLQIFLNQQIDTSVQKDFTDAIETLDDDLTVTYQDNLDEFNEPKYYKNNQGNKTKLSPALVIHEVREPATLDDMFSNLGK
tara:strand:+ start:314 stop:655 length:342 start_codon:yes stop_codon:yes gene_type:complete